MKDTELADAELAVGEATVLVTVQPSYLLRLPDAKAKAREFAAFVTELAQAARLAEAASDA